YHHVESCQETVPEAITAFMEGNDFEDVIRTAVSLGGDCDTLTCIAGSMAEAFFGIPEDMKAECRKRLNKDMLDVLGRFDERIAANKEPFHDMFLDGNELVEDAIRKCYEDGSKDDLDALLEVIRHRMHEDGHFIFPIERSEDDETRFSFRTLTDPDGNVWHAAFTSHEEYKKGLPSEVVSYFIDEMLRNSLESGAAGIVINPWGQSFRLANELIKRIIEADGDVEYSVPGDPITAELLEDGSYLKRAIEICNRNRTQLNVIKLARILRDSVVWMPCTAVFSEADQKAMDKLVREAQEKGDLDSLKDQTFTSHDKVRMVPDILQNGDNYFFPVFTSEEEMGEYGEQFSKIPGSFLGAMDMARNNEKNIRGIVINAFTEPFDVPVEIFDTIANMESSIEQEGEPE
ncbi:MAG: SseB family protein, partial [Eubacterium sp.]|nr:SseB family protein [Eubacterium sp.]